MLSKPLHLGLVRRGYSPSGGAESYLKRLGQGVRGAGHQARLFTTGEWPASEWSWGGITRVAADSAIAFADEMKRLRTQRDCDLLISLERIWECDLYRAGDGVHLAWLERKKHFQTALERVAERFTRKHRDLLRLEESLFARMKARRVVVNSQMIKGQIIESYGYPADRIDIIYNGVPVAEFLGASADRENSRRKFGIAAREIVVLFAGTGWERKGLRFAIEAIAGLNDPRFRLLVAGRGNDRKFRAKGVYFLGEQSDLRPAYAAADIFLLPTLYDPFSNACLEALASGLPVITTRHNGFSEIIEDQVHGSIVDRADEVQALRAALLYWADEDQRAASRPAILARAAEFDISRNVDRTLAIISQVAASAAST